MSPKAYIYGAPVVNPGVRNIYIGRMLLKKVPAESSPGNVKK